MSWHYRMMAPPELETTDSAPSHGRTDSCWQSEWGTLAGAAGRTLGDGESHAYAALQHQLRLAMAQANAAKASKLQRLLQAMRRWWRATR